jgi:hypothetical protein
MIPLPKPFTSSARFAQKNNSVRAPKQKFELPIPGNTTTVEKFRGLNKICGGFVVWRNFSKLIFIYSMF